MSEQPDLRELLDEAILQAVNLGALIRTHPAIKGTPMALEMKLREARAALGVPVSPAVIPADAIDAIRTLPHITVEPMRGLWVELEAVVGLLRGWASAVAIPEYDEDPYEHRSRLLAGVPVSPEEPRTLTEAAQDSSYTSGNVAERPDLRAALERVTNAAEMLSHHAKHPDDRDHLHWFPFAIGDVDREVEAARAALRATDVDRPPDAEPWCPCGGRCHHTPNPCSLSCIAGEARRATDVDRVAPDEETHGLDFFHRWASKIMRQRLDDGARKFGALSWQTSTYTDNDNATRLLRAVDHLFVVLRRWRDPESNEFIDAIELRKRAADVANQAFMLADVQRRDGGEPFTVGAEPVHPSLGDDLEALAEKGAPRP